MAWLVNGRHGPYGSLKVFYRMKMMHVWYNGKSKMENRISELCKGFSGCVLEQQCATSQQRSSHKEFLKLFFANILSLFSKIYSCFILCFVDRVSVYNIIQMKPARCTLLLSIFISTSLHVSGNYVPIIRRTYCIYATLVFFTLYGWLSGLQTRQPETCREVEINTLRSCVHLVGFI